MAKKKKFKKWKFKVFVFFMLVDIVFFIIYGYSNKMVTEIAKTHYQAMLSSASYYAIDSAIKNGYNYSDFISIEKDKDNNVTMVTTNSLKFNNLTSYMAEKVTEYFLQNAQIINVPVGVFSGIRLLAGFGPKVQMKVINISSIKCQIVSKFEGAGINQTRHSLYVDITPDVSVIVGGKSTKLTDNITFLIFENFIAGKVPEFYMTGGVYTSKKYV